MMVAAGFDITRNPAITYRPIWVEGALALTPPKPLSFPAIFLPPTASSSSHAISPDPMCIQYYFPLHPHLNSVPISLDNNTKSLCLLLVATGVSRVLPMPMMQSGELQGVPSGCALIFCWLWNKSSATVEMPATLKLKLTKGNVFP